MRTYLMYYAASTSVAGAVSILFGKTGRIKSVRHAIIFDSITDSAVLQLELANQGAAFGSAANDAQGIYWGCSLISNFVTSGLAQPSYNGQVMVDYPVEAASRIYLNTTGGGTYAALIRLWIDVAE